jgi:hypothetical protein
VNWKKFLVALADDPSETGTHRLLRDGIRILAAAQKSKSEKKPHALALKEQPFDSMLLRSSPLFARSRKFFLDQGGSFYPTLLSSPRTLSSPSLLENQIEYSPVEKELIWAATDGSESGDVKKLTRLFQTRAYVTSLFHEQNHRILWNTLPSPSSKHAEASRYLNLAESLVIGTDMALGDEMGHGISRVFYLSGVTYDPGTDIGREKPTQRAYRNYIHACIYATYMKLEFYETKDIIKAIHHLYPQDKKLTERAIQRALRLDDDFVRITNPMWQESNLDTVIGVLNRKLRGRGKVAPPRETLALPKDALDNRLQYLWSERWMEMMGL